MLQFVKLRQNVLLSRQGYFSENLQEKQDENNCYGFWDQAYSIRSEFNRDFCTGRMLVINIWGISLLRKPEC